MEPQCGANGQWPWKIGDQGATLDWLWKCFEVACHRNQAVKVGPLKCIDIDGLMSSNKKNKEHEIKTLFA